mgnify:CR=1 FL=1
MPIITKTKCGCYETIFRKRVYTLIEVAGSWSMWSKPINGRASPPKSFGSLDEVEKAYKHWRGVAELVAKEVSEVENVTTFH